jgi:hypothetical protein
MVANLAEAKSHAITPEVFLQHDREIATAKREHEDTSAALARAKKAAKTGAVDLEAYKFIEKMRKLEDDEQAIVLRHIQQYAVWLEMPWGTQFSLLDAPKVPSPKAKAKTEHAVWAAGEAGLRAGRDGETLDQNPNMPGSEEHAAWARSYLTGLSERATAARMAADAEAERPADVAEATSKAAQGRQSKRGRGRAAQVGLSLDNAKQHLNGASTH